MGLTGQLGGEGGQIWISTTGARDININEPPVTYHTWNGDAASLQGDPDANGLHCSQTQCKHQQAFQRTVCITDPSLVSGKRYDLKSPPDAIYRIKVTTVVPEIILIINYH